MLAEDEIAQKRREEYDEATRVLLSKVMSEKGGVLTKGFTEGEMEAKFVNFFQDLVVLQMKYIDVIREDWGFARDDNSATFGEDVDHRWEHFVKNHVVKDEKGKDTILYADKDGKYRLIPNVCPTIEQLEFVIKNYDKIYKNEDNEEIELKPSITILGIEGVAWSKYLDFNLSVDHKDFYLRQVMILLGELLDVVERNRVYLKEVANDELFKALAEKVKKVF